MCRSESWIRGRGCAIKLKGRGGEKETRFRRRCSMAVSRRDAISLLDASNQALCSLYLHDLLYAHAFPHVIKSILIYNQHVCLFSRSCLRVFGIQNLAFFTLFKIAYNF